MRVGLETRADRRRRRADEGDEGDGRARVAPHFYASALLDAGEGIKALPAHLGHAESGCTLRVYTHLVPAGEDRTPGLDDLFHDTRPGRTPWGALSVVAGSLRADSGLRARPIVPPGVARW